MYLGSLRLLMQSAFKQLLLLISLSGFSPSLLLASPVHVRSKPMNTASTYVVVDQSEKAFTVFTGIPTRINKKQFESIKLKVSSRKTLTMLTWQRFLENVDRYAKSVMLRNDYPNSRVVDGIVCLVGSKKGSGAPWGLTWNGGIALTYNDYQHARKTYKSYMADPGSYKPIRDPRKDPVNPSGHLPFGGCAK